MRPSYEDTRQRSGGFSRRAFLGGLGVGAVAAALDPNTAIAAARQAEADGVLTNAFGRIFQLPAFADATDRVRAGPVPHRGHHVPRSVPRP